MTESVWQARVRALLKPESKQHINLESTEPTWLPTHKSKVLMQVEVCHNMLKEIISKVNCNLTFVHMWIGMSSQPSKKGKQLKLIMNSETRKWAFLVLDQTAFTETNPKFNNPTYANSNI